MPGEKQFDFLSKKNSLTWNSRAGRWCWSLCLRLRPRSTQVPDPLGFWSHPRFHLARPCSILLWSEQFIFNKPPEQIYVCTVNTFNIFWTLPLKTFFLRKKWVRILIRIICLLLGRVRTVLCRHLGTSTCYSNWILHQSSLKGSRLLPNYYCIIVFTFCLKLFFLAGKSWLSCEFPSSLLDASSRTNVTFSEFRPFDCKKYMIVPTILNKCIKSERGEPKGQNTRQITFLILKMPK